MDQIILEISRSELFKIVGGAGVIIIGLSVWLSSLVAEKIKQRWQRDNNLKIEDSKKQANIELENAKKSINIEIEDLKGKISQNNSVINTLLGQKGQVYQKVLDERIKASKRAWEVILDIKKEVPHFVSLVYDLLTEEELNKANIDKDRGKGSLGDDIAKVSIQDIAVKQNVLLDELKKLRPFFSAKLSLLVDAYAGVIGRSTYLLINDYAASNIKLWINDQGLKQILINVLNENEMEYIYKELYFNHYSTTIDLLETKILNEINFMISGDSLVNDTIDQVNKITKIFAETAVNRII